MANASPANRDSSRSGSAAKSTTPARGSRSRVGGTPRSVSGRRHSRGSPSAATISAIPVRFSGVCSAASTTAISSIDNPQVVRSPMIRSRAASLAGADFGPGVAVTKNPRRPARKSRTSVRTVSTV